MIFNWITLEDLRYGDYRFPSWAHGMGWGLAAISLMCLPFGMILSVAQSSGRNFAQVNETCYCWLIQSP